MLNVYDIILNLLDSNRVYEFFEWSNKDNIEHIKKIPMVRVSSKFLKDIVKNNITIDKEFLKKIYQKTEIYTDEGSDTIDYACLFTNNIKVVAVEFNKEGKSLFKSYLLLDEEEEILELSDQIELTNIDYKVIRKNNEVLFLTREEEFRRNYLLKELKYAYKKGLYEKINYLYKEAFSKDNNTLEEKYQLMLADIKDNYSKKYNNIYKILNLTHSKKKTTN